MTDSPAPSAPCRSPPPRCWPPAARRPEADAADGGDPRQPARARRRDAGAHAVGRRRADLRMPRKAADASCPEWVFVAPEARLVDANGMLVGHHYAGPTWEAGDGSKVVGTVKAKVDSPDAARHPLAAAGDAQHRQAGPVRQGHDDPARGHAAASRRPRAAAPRRSASRSACLQAQYAQYAPTL